MNTTNHPQYKLSRYIAATDPIIRNAYRMVFSTRTTSTLFMKESAYQQLLLGEFDTLDLEYIEKLKAAKILVPCDSDELSVIIKENKKAIAENTTLYTGIAPSADCQLGCDYCGQTHTKDKMGNATHDRLVARVEKKLQKNTAFEKVKIAWFGGEPLTGLKSIYALSSRLMALAAAHGCEYDSEIVTNGLALTPDVYYKLVSQCHVTDFEITLDGAEKYHDARRHTKKGHATFSLIMKNLLDIIKDPRFDQNKAAITIRCNVDMRNYDGTTELIDFLDANGVLQKVKFYTAPIHSWGNSAHLEALPQKSYADFELEVLATLLKKQANVTILPGKAHKIVCMSLQNDAELIDAFGDVYNCSEISQVASYKEVGIYKIDELTNQGAPFNERAFVNWNDDILVGKVPCHDCRILPICGGACPKLWTEGTSPCPAIKQNIEQRLILQALSLKNAGALAAREVAPS